MKQENSTACVDASGGVEVDRDTDGELLIDWSPSPRRMLTLSLRADGRLSYAFTWDDEKAHGTVQMPAGVTPSDVPERTSSQKMADKGYTRRPRQIPPEGEDGVAPSDGGKHG